MVRFTGRRADGGEAGVSIRAEIERRADEILARCAELEDADVVHEVLTARVRAMSR